MQKSPSNICFKRMLSLAYYVNKGAIEIKCHSSRAYNEVLILFIEILTTAHSLKANLSG